MSKRIILFGPLPPPYGGVSVFLSSLLEHLKEASILVWAYFGSRSDDRRTTRFNHRRLGVIKALATQGYQSRIVDFTHFHLEYPHSILLPIWLIAKSLLRIEWIKYILDGSLPDRYSNFQSSRKRRFEKALGKIDEFIVVSEELRNWLISEMNVTKKITVIPCLLNIPPENQLIKLANETQQVVNEVSKHQKWICSIGTFIPSYGFDQLADAVEQLRDKTHEDIGLLLLDGTFASDVAFKERVLANRDWMEVLTNVPNPEVYHILSRCDLFIRYCEHESYGISRVEAIWAGVPVIATDVGETRGMLTVQFGDVDALTRKIHGVLSGEEKLDLETWAHVYHAEADANLNCFIETVGIDLPPKVVRLRLTTDHAEIASQESVDSSYATYKSSSSEV